MKRIVSHYMISNPKSVNSKDSLSEVLKTMDKESISHAIVVGNDSEIVGVISRNDLLLKLKTIAESSSGKTYTGLEFKNIKAQDIMTEDIITVSKQDPVEYAIELLLQKQFHCLPVVEDNKAVGIVTFFDLLKGYYQEHG